MGGGTRMEPVAQARHLIQLPVACVAAFGVFEPPQEWQESRSSFPDHRAGFGSKGEQKGAAWVHALGASAIDRCWRHGRGGAKEMTQEKIGTPAPCSLASQCSPVGSLTLGQRYATKK